MRLTGRGGSEPGQGCRECLALRRGQVAERRTELVVVDPENSVFYDSYRTRDLTLTRACSSRIEGIGRPKVEPSFQHDVIDRMIPVPDTASVAAMLWLERQTGRKAGPSTGTNIWGTLQVAREMQAAGRTGSVVTLMCDSGQRYLDTYYNPDWVRDRIGDIAPDAATLARFSG
mgnify:CR=1 FL=1